MSVPVTMLSPCFAATNMTKNASDVATMPSVILTGVEGSRPRRSSQRHSEINGTVSTRTQPALMAFEMMPDTFQSVFSFAQYVSVEPFWWNTIQNTITIR